MFTDPSSVPGAASRRVHSKPSQTKAVPNPPVSGASFKEVLAEAVKAPEKSSEIRRELVEEYKSALANGSYEVKAGELAEKMVQKIRENKTRAII